MEDQEKKNIRKAYIIIGVMLLISVLYASASANYMYLNVYIWFGLAYGMAGSALPPPHVTYLPPVCREWLSVFLLP
jgi:hypothetical protein